MLSVQLSRMIEEKEPSFRIITAFKNKKIQFDDLGKRFVEKS